MSRRLVAVPALAAVTGLGLYLALLADRVGQPLPLEVALLAGPAALLGVLVRRLRPGREGDRRQWTGLPRRRRQPDHPGLEEMTGLVESALGTGFVTHRLRRVLVDLAGERLWSRHQVDWQTNPAGARALLGERCWQLLHGDSAARPDQPGGMPVADLRLLVDCIEAL